jgi:ABC-type multidrug transport system fused ATPase/permease subunit
MCVCVWRAVGVVGRTGAGKSSLINALFRLVELDDGALCIDGRDISTLGLHQVRPSLTALIALRWAE